ncbi:general substrate transporter [Dichotomocladium elegans]|nr:general substrate transporter [Dichotomocladium elegans]
MDSRKAKYPRYMVFCVVASCIGSFSNGWTIGSPNIPGEATYGCTNGAAHVNNHFLPDCLPMDSLLWGIAVSTFCLGGLVASFSASYFLTKFGRVNTIMYANTGWIFGSLLMAFATSPVMFAAGRFFSGMSCGMGSVATPTYNGEISTIKSRGAMGTLNQLFIVIGILLSNLIGLGLNSVPLWRINYGLVLVPAITQVAVMKFCVESPRYLVSVNDIDGARTALQKLRGKESNIDKELNDIIDGQRSSNALEAVEASSFTKDGTDFEKSIGIIEADTSKKAYGIIDLFYDRVVRKITLIVVILHAVQQFSAVNGVMYYSTIIFKEAFDSKTSIYMAISTSGVNLIVTIVSVYLMDKAGRKVLLIIAQTGGCIAAFILAVAGLFSISALLVASVFLFVTFFAIGLGPIPWLLTSEIAPTHAASAMTAVATGINWGANFLVALVFPKLMDHLHSSSFFIFGSVLFFSAVFTMYYVPETRGKSIEEINAMFECAVRPTLNNDLQKSLS